MEDAGAVGLVLGVVHLSPRGSAHPRSVRIALRRAIATKAETLGRLEPYSVNMWRVVRQKLQPIHG